MARLRTHRQWRTNTANRVNPKTTPSFILPSFSPLPSPLAGEGLGVRGESDYLHSIFRQTVKEPFVANHKLFIRVCTDQRIVLDHRNNAFPLTHPFEMLHSPPHPQPLSHEGRGEPENLGS